MSSRFRSSTDLCVLELGIVGHAEHAQARLGIDDEIRNLLPLRGHRERRDRDVGLAGGKDRHFRLVADRDDFKLHAEALGIFLGKQPCRTGKLRTAARSVLGKPWELADRRDFQHASFLDGVDFWTLPGCRNI